MYLSSLFFYFFQISAGNIFLCFSTNNKLSCTSSWYFLPLLIHYHIKKTFSFCLEYFSSGIFDYTYPPVNLLATLTDPNSAKTTYTYDNGNREISMAYPNGVTTTYGYDNANHVTSIKALKGATTVMTTDPSGAL
jgi:hypothetical protein